MRYELLISDEARKQLRELPVQMRRNVGYRLELLQDNFTGNVKKLEAARNHYRHRVGVYRVLFRLNGANIEVYAVKPRRDAYE